jgi:hypothetical protein
MGQQCRGGEGDGRILTCTISAAAPPTMCSPRTRCEGESTMSLISTSGAGVWSGGERDFLCVWG